MLRLFPPPSSVNTDSAGATAVIDDVATAVAVEDRTGPGDRPWVLTNMIASADGGTAVDGLSGGLGGPGDRAVFTALRATADVIIAGATTVRDEQYRAPSPPSELMAARQERGQQPRPRVAVFTRSLNLDPDLPLFGDAENRPYVITTTAAPAERRERLEDVAEIIEAGDDSVDLTAALMKLADRGAQTVLCEGGPSLNGQFIEAGLIDEWNLSIAPALLGADSRRAAVGPMAAGPPLGMKLSRVWTDDSFLFCRWVRG